MDQSPLMSQEVPDLLRALTEVEVASEEAEEVTSKIEEIIEEEVTITAEVITEVVEARELSMSQLSEFVI